MKKESGKWKTTLKMAAGSVGFLAGLCVVLILAGRFLCRKSNADIYDTTAVRTKDAEVKNEVKDTIDVLFLGDVRRAWLHLIYLRDIGTAYVRLVCDFTGGI